MLQIRVIDKESKIPLIGELGKFLILIRDLPINKLSNIWLIF